MSATQEHPKINYLIATCNTRTRRVQPVSEHVLAIQMYTLQRIFKQKKQLGLPNYISQITIIEPPAKAQPYDHYYNRTLTSIEGVPIQYLPYVGKNEHYSYDQYLQGLIASHPKFDYYLIIEDDYCVSPDNPTFDIELVQHYNEAFKDNIGYLCSIVESCDWNNEKYVYNSISNGLISAATFDRVLRSTNNNVLKAYYTSIPPVHHFLHNKQVMFTELFRKCDVPHADIIKEYNIVVHGTFGDLQDYTTLFGFTASRKLFMPAQEINNYEQITTKYPEAKDLWEFVEQTVG